MKRSRIWIVVFWLYSALMLWLLFGRSGAIAGVDYWEQVGMSLNLRPFQTVMRYVRLLDSSRPYLVRLAVINLFGNVIMFIPLGFLLPKVFPKLQRLHRTLLVITVTITAVELLQLFTLVGSCDIDDLILNVVGAAVGYGIFKFTNK